MRCNSTEYFESNFEKENGKRGSSVVECQTPEREIRESKPTSAVLCP